jgi:hypothetical protein
VAPERLTLEALTRKHFIQRAATPAEQRRLATLLDLHGKGDQAALIDGPDHPAAAERAWFAGPRHTPFFSPEAAPEALRRATAALPDEPRAVRTLWLAAQSAGLAPTFLASVAEQWRRDWPESPEALLAMAMSVVPAPETQSGTPIFDLTWTVWQQARGWSAQVDAFGFPRSADALYAAFEDVEIQSVEQLPMRGRAGWRARVRFESAPQLQDYRIVEALGGPRAAFTASPDATEARQEAGRVRVRLSLLELPPGPTARRIEVPDLGSCQARLTRGMFEQRWTLPARTVAMTLLEENRTSLRELRACGWPTQAPTTE